jgi:phosphohistidine phosphatase
MTLYLVRHGIAADLPPGGRGGDDARELTPRGIARTRTAARGFVRLFGAVDAVASSPLPRARRTVELFAAALKLKAPPALARELAPGAGAVETAAWLARQEAESLLVVGHMPHLANVASLLLAGREGLALEFRKAGVCALAFDGRAAAGKARLIAFLPARALRAAARS